MYLVARVGATVVGYAGLLMIADDGHVATVAVDPAWQRRGLATRLLVELVRGAMELGANQLTLEVRMSNTGRPGPLPQPRLRPGRRPQGVLRATTARTPW